MQVPGYSQIHMHLTYVALNKMTLYTDAWLYGVHRTSAEMAAVSHGTSHVTTTQHFNYTSVDIDKHTV